MLKVLELVLKTWNKYVFGNLDSQIESLKEVVSNVDYLPNLRIISVEEIANMCSLLRIEDS